MSSSSQGNKDLTTPVSSISIGTFLVYISGFLESPYSDFLNYIAPSASALCALIWPSYWERFIWKRARLMIVKEINNRLSELSKLKSSSINESSVKMASENYLKWEQELIRIKSLKFGDAIKIQISKEKENGREQEKTKRTSSNN